MITDANPWRGARQPASLERGSKRRIRKLQMRGTLNVHMWLLIVWAIFMLFVLLPWMMKHDFHDNHTGQPPPVVAK